MAAEFVDLRDGVKGDVQQDCLFVRGVGEDLAVKVVHGATNGDIGKIFSAVIQQAFIAKLRGIIDKNAAKLRGMWRY